MTTVTSLFLAPVDPDAAPDTGRISRVLRQLDLIAGELGPNVYAAGDGFSRHVVFAGCSPHLVMQPPEDGSLRFCHLALHGPFARPMLVTGPNTVRPRCPACRARFDDWRTRLDDWMTGRAEAGCSACGRTWSPHRLDWRGHAVSGRVLVELRNVYPGEASPSDLLMHSLQQATGAAWRSAWAACRCG